MKAKHDRRAGRRWRLRQLASVAGLLLANLSLAHLAYAIDPQRTLSQYIRDRWDSEKGFPGGAVHAIAQTPDGYLWIGTEKGLVRFDGLSFLLFQQATPGSLPIGPVLGLAADADRNLWIQLQSTKVLRYRDGKFEPGHDEAEFSITAMYRGGNGDFLLSSLTYGPLRYAGGRFATVMAQGELPSLRANTPLDTNSSVATRSDWSSGYVTHRLAPPYSPVTSLAETGDGRVWLGTRDKGLFYVKGGKVASIAGTLPDQKINCMLAAGKSDLWIGTDKGVLRWNGSDLSRAVVPAALQHAQVLTLLRDRDSNIWAGTAEGLERVNAGGISRDESGSRLDTPVTALFEDREGNIWAGGTQGIERLRDSAFVTYSVADGLPESNGPVYVDKAQRTWFAPLEGGLYWLTHGKVARVTEAGLGQDVVYSITGDGNDLWVGRQRGGLTRLHISGKSILTNTYTQASGLAQNSVYAVHRSPDGSVWAGTLSGGVSQFRSGRFTTYTTANGMASNTVNAIAETADGTLWFATPNGVNALSKGVMQDYGVREGLPSAYVSCLLADSAGILWIGSGAGLAYFSSHKIQIPLQLPEALHEQIFGIAEDRSGSLWIATSNHVLRAKRAELLAGSANNADEREYGLDDGLLGAEGVKRYQSVVTDPLGRIWFSMNRGLSVVDPSRTSFVSGPALVHVEATSADGNAIDPKGVVRAAARDRISFIYAGLSLSNPERIRYRYRLEGFDRDWSEPTVTRTAIYTNLNPGSYQFRVVASNSDGLWNGAEASFPFEVDPVWWQTWWFRLSLLLTVGFAVLTVYRLRLRQLTAQLNVRFEERLAERTRIAQDLHDTLLQGFLSASMQLDVANDRLEANSPAKPIVTRVIQLVGQVIEDGRRTVRGLRSSDGGSDNLEQSFSRIPQELAVQAVDFRVIVGGQVRTVHPFIRDEVYRIGREALANAFRHSGGDKVEVELDYTDRQLRVLIRDNGRGIDPDVLTSGRDGHWGLSGMRERAGRIGAKIKVWSRDAGGTEVELTVPGHLAFRFQSHDRMSQWFARRRKVERDAAIRKEN
jgi:ligand-binding sensor domain-containing protein/signal transduction histidine kinase